MPRRSFAVLVALAVLAAFSLVELPVAEAAVPGQNDSIVFTSTRDGNFEVYSMKADGSAQTNLTNDPANDYAPAGSPGGSKVAFVSERDGNPEIYVMDRDGTDPVRLTNNPANDYAPAWSPDAGSLVFESERDGNAEIYRMDADGTDVVRLTDNTATDLEPEVSPDGSQIAFDSNRDGNIEIYVMNADGSAQTRLTSNSAIDGQPDWSPWGVWITFTSNRDGNFEIYRMDADGTGQTNLTKHPANDFTPAYSPDGTAITFASDRAGSFDVWVMGPAGTQAAERPPSGEPLQQLTTSPGLDAEADMLLFLNLITVRGLRGLDVFLNDVIEALVDGTIKNAKTLDRRLDKAIDLFLDILEKAFPPVFGEDFETVFLSELSPVERAVAYPRFAIAEDQLTDALDAIDSLLNAPQVPGLSEIPDQTVDELQELRNDLEQVRNQVDSGDIRNPAELHNALQPSLEQFHDILSDFFPELYSHSFLGVFALLFTFSKDLRDVPKHFEKAVKRLRRAIRLKKRVEKIVQNGPD